MTEHGRLIDADALMDKIVNTPTTPCAKKYVGNFVYMDGTATRQNEIIDMINEQPAIEPERTGYIPDTKEAPPARRYVDLDEKVTSTYYDAENEEWSQKTTTIEDVLASVCDEYTIISQTVRGLGFKLAARPD